MVSAVELGKIDPSLKALAFFSDRLEVPLAALLPASDPTGAKQPEATVVRNGETAEKWILGPNDLGNWFLRLNGCVTMVNFVVHGRRHLRNGEFDILAVRFQDRREILPSGEELRDHRRLLGDGRTDLIIAETTRSDCKLNGPWATEDGRLRYVLQAIGAFVAGQLDEVVQELHRERALDRHPAYRVRVFAFGREIDPELGASVEQFTWAHVLGWIYDRFEAHRAGKSYHEPWDRVGNDLWAASEAFDRDRFVLEGLRAMSVPERYAAFTD